MNFRLFPMVLVLCCIGTSVAASTEFGDMPVRSMEQRAATRELGTLLPEAHHVIILLDAENAQSQRYLHALLGVGYPGFRTTIVLVSGTNRTTPGSIDLSGWPEAQLLRTDRGAARKYLSKGGSPLVIGVDADGRSVWIRSGRPSQALSQAHQMLEWLE